MRCDLSNFDRCDGCHLASSKQGCKSCTRSYPLGDDLQVVGFLGGIFLSRVCLVQMHHKMSRQHDGARLSIKRTTELHDSNTAKGL